MRKQRQTIRMQGTELCTLFKKSVKVKIKEISTNSHYKISSTSFHATHTHVSVGSPSRPRARVSDGPTEEGPRLDTRPQQTPVKGEERERGRKGGRGVSVYDEHVRVCQKKEKMSMKAIVF